MSSKPPCVATNSSITNSGLLITRRLFGNKHQVRYFFNSNAMLRQLTLTQLVYSLPYRHFVSGIQTLSITANKNAVVSPNSSHPFSATIAPMRCQRSTSPRFVCP